MGTVVKTENELIHHLPDLSETDVVLVICWCSYALSDYATRHNRRSVCCRSIHVRCVFQYCIDSYGDSAVFSHKSHNL